MAELGQNKLEYLSTRSSLRFVLVTVMNSTVLARQGLSESSSLSPTKSYIMKATISPYSIAVATPIYNIFGHSLVIIALLIGALMSLLLRFKSRA